MANTLHIVHGLSAKGTLKLYFEQTNINEDIFALEIVLKYGHFSNDELKYHPKFDRELFLNYNDFEHYTKCDNLTEFIDYNFDEYEKIVVWHGNNVEDLLMLYLSCSLIKGKLYDVDISEIKYLFPHLTQVPFSLPLYACSIENLYILYSKIKPITNELKQKNRSLWLESKRTLSGGPLIIIDCLNNLLKVNYDYFDEFILSKCTYEYENVAKIIAIILCDIDFGIGDSFLHARIINLIRQNKLVASINEKFMKEIEQSNHLDKNKIIVNGVNVTEMRFFSVRLI